MLKKQIRILITGSAGFIGFHLTKKLLKEGFIIHGLDNLNSYYDVKLKKQRLIILNKFKNYHHIKIDIQNFKNLSKHFSVIKPNIVIHLAAQAGVRYSIDYPGKYIESNIVGFYNIIQLSQKFKVKYFIYASSSSVYGSVDEKSFSEQTQTDLPISLYAATKKSNELIANAYNAIYGLKTIGLRFFTVYGPMGRPDMALYKFTSNILDKKTITVYNNGNHFRDFTYIDDIVDGIFKLLNKLNWGNTNKNFSKIYNLGNGRPQKLNTFIKIIEDNLGITAKKKYTNLQLGDVERTHADIKLAKKDFGFNPQTQLKKGISNFIKWYREYYGK